MSIKKVRLKGNKRRLTAPWPLGALPHSVITEIGKYLVHRLAIGHTDITGDDFGSIFAQAIDGEHKSSPLGIADVILEGNAWSVKTIKSKNPFKVSKARFISGRNSPDYSLGIENVHKNVEATGKAVLRIWNSRINEALGEYDDLRIVHFIRNLETKEFVIFEESAEKFIVENYEWNKNKHGNFQGHHKQTGVHKFTWQSHGAQFTIIKIIPSCAIKFIINGNPSVMEVEHILRLARFKPTWIEIIG